jgi:hypothetical protein
MDAYLRFFCVYVVLCRQRLYDRLIPRPRSFRLILHWEQARGTNPSTEEEKKEK